MNTATQKLPTIDEGMLDQAETQAAALAVIAPAKLPSVKDAVLAQFKSAEAAVLALAEKYRAVVYPVTTPKGLAEAKAARHELREFGRFAVQRAEKAVKSDVNDLKRVMSTEVERLVAIVQPVEDAIDAQIKAEEERKAAEKAERDRIEAERVAKHQANLAKIRSYADQAKGQPAAKLAAACGVMAETILAFNAEAWEEFAEEAEAALQAAAQDLEKLRDAAIQAEAEAARLEAQRIEQARIAAEQAQRQAALDALQAKIDAENAAMLARVAQQTRDREAAALEAERIERLAAAAAEEIVKGEKAAAASGTMSLGGVSREVIGSTEGVNRVVMLPTPVLSDKAVADANARAWVDSLPTSAPAVALVNRNVRRRIEGEGAPTPVGIASVAELRNEWVLFEAALEHVSPVIERYAASVDRLRFDRAVLRMRAIFSQPTTTEETIQC